MDEELEHANVAGLDRRSVVLAALGMAATVAGSAVAAGSQGASASPAEGLGGMLSSISDLRAIPKAGRKMAYVAGYYQAGDGGGGIYLKRFDAAPAGWENGGTRIVATDGGAWELVPEDGINVRQFGARGNDDQATYAADYRTDTRKLTAMKMQTADGIAINRAISYLRSIGGGKLRIPKGVYRVYGYLETIDFPCYIYGDGVDSTILKNCDASPVNTDGYGIFEVEPVTKCDVAFSNMTLDGNATLRKKPEKEFRSYPIAFYGKVNGRVTSLKSVNSPIDCFYTNYENSDDCSMQVSNCIFENSFRNTMSLVSGWNQSYSNCEIKGGGMVHGGTNPRYCLDIEPNNSANPIKNLKFANCSFSGAINAIVGGTWCEATFVGCNIHAVGGLKPGMPWAFLFGQSRVSMMGCRVSGDADSMQNLAKSFNTYVPGNYKDDQYLKIIGCEFIGCGFHAIGRRTFIQNTSFVNSRAAIVIEGSGKFKNEVYISGLTAINVVDCVNLGAVSSSLVVKGIYNGRVLVENVSIVIDEESLPAKPSFASLAAMGVFIKNPVASSAEVKVSNVHVCGYYKAYPSATRQAPNPGNFRDWGMPILAPANSPGQSVVKGTVYFNNCTMCAED